MIHVQPLARARLWTMRQVAVEELDTGVRSFATVRRPGGPAVNSPGREAGGEAQRMIER
jgi:hypothetical protein